MSELTIESWKRDNKKIKRVEEEVKHVWQWYWDTDYLGNKYKAIYYGPRLEWMNLTKEKKKNERRRKK
tara:strand:+ start:33 stop:236 length:204 start_codon:yes stop_codon:yes gene_type:complete